MSRTPPLAVLSRITKRSRLLVLGYPIANRPDPLRAAEELARLNDAAAQAGLQNALENLAAAAEEVVFRGYVLQQTRR